MADDLPARLVDALNALYGSHPGHRAAHANGVLCAATFTATPEAATLSRAPHLVAGGEIRAHVRFSNGSGDPTRPDTARDGRGMAVKLYLPEGGTTDIVALSVPVFFARTPDDFLAFSHARVPDPATGKPDLARVGAYLEQHPEALPSVQFGMAEGVPRSYAVVPYHAIHAFRFVAADGSARHIRYPLVPEGAAEPLGDDERRSLPADHLRREIGERLERGPVEYHLDAQLAADGDPVDDPTAVWPEDREVVRLGTLRITGLAFDRERDGDVLVFDPTRVTDGIELTDDPLIRARADAYRESVARRTSS